MSKILIYCFSEKLHHPPVPPPSYFTGSPPPYSVAVSNDRSPQELLAELQPEQRPLRNRNVSINYSHNVVQCIEKLTKYSRYACKPSPQA